MKDDFFAVPEHDVPRVGVGSKKSPTFGFRELLRNLGERNFLFDGPLNVLCPVTNWLYVLLLRLCVAVLYLC